MSAEADTLCAADFGERTEDRLSSRNGYRMRPLETRVGEMALRIPRLRAGSCFPEWLLKPRRRSQRALLTVVAEACVLGVSTRRVERLMETLGLSGISKSRVSEVAGELDQGVEAFRRRPLESAYPWLWLDALEVRSREGGRTVNVTVVVATGVNETGHREVLGVDVVTSEDGAAWPGFLRSLVARGLHGVTLTISDAPFALKAAIAAALPGSAWQRCCAHFVQNLLTAVSESPPLAVSSLFRSVSAQPDADSARAQFDSVPKTFEERFAKAGALLGDAREELRAFTFFPEEHWRRIWSSNPQERLDKEIRRRTDVVGVLPDREAIVRLVGALLAEQHDEWAIGRRYFSLGSLTVVLDPARATSNPDQPAPLSAA